MKTVVIFGGSGFIGNHIIRRLAKNGYKIIVPFQYREKKAKLRFFGSVGQIIPIEFKNLTDKKVLKSIQIADVVINLKTQWKKKPVSFEEGIFDFNVELVKIINKFNKNKLFLYFSGLGIDNSSSKRTAAIAKTEKFIKQNCINASIIRPGVVIGGGDQFLKKLLKIIQISFLLPIFGSKKTMIQPVFVDDVSKGVEKIIQNNIKDFHIFEFVGNEVFTYESFYALVLENLSINRIIINIPYSLGLVGAFIFERIGMNLITVEQMKLLKKDSIAINIDKDLKNLNIDPQDIRGILNIHLKK